MLVMMVFVNIIYFIGYDWMWYNYVSFFFKLLDEFVFFIVGFVVCVFVVIVVSFIELVCIWM